MERKLSLAAGVMVALVTLSLLIDIASIAELYDLVSVPVDNSILISELIKVLALLWICRYLQVVKIIWPAALLALAILIRTFAPEHLQSLIDLTGIEYFLSSIAVNLVGACIACIMWAVVGTHLCLNKKAQTALNGYAPVLATAAFIICVFEIVYFLETPKLIGYLCMGVGLIGLYLSLFASKFTLAYRARSHLFTAVVGIPSVIYVMPVMIIAAGMVKDAGTAIYHDTEYWESTGKTAAPLDRINAWQPFLDESLSGYEIQSAQGLFSDIWIFADGRQMAVGVEGVFQRGSGQGKWSFVFEPDEAEASAIRFDSNGVRGVLDLGYGSVATTTDGGATWHQPDLFKVFEELMGREYGEKISDDYSMVYLDPATGAGSFVMGCHFFSTDNFAREWKVTGFDVKEGKTRCLGDSPFALDEKLGVAMTSSLTGSNILYVRLEDGEWDKRCVTDKDYYFGNEPSCDEDDILTEAQLAYIDNLHGHSESLNVHSELIDQIMASDQIDKAALQHAVRDNGTHKWLVGQGYLVFLDDKGQFEVDYRVPALDAIYPIDGKTALGAAGSSLYQTMDAGRTWARLHREEHYIEVLNQAALSAHIYYSAGSTLYRRSDNKSVALFEGSENSGIDALISSPDGKSLLLQTFDRHYWFSHNAGVDWQQKDFPYPAEIDDYGDTPDMTSFDCVLDDPVNECVALYDNGQVFRWKPDEPSSHSALPDMKVSEDTVDMGVLSIFNAAPRYQYLVAADTSQHRKLIDNKWELTRLPQKFSYFHAAKHTPDRTKALYWTDDYEVLLVDAGGENQMFEFTDDTEVASFCSDHTGDLMVLTAHNQLAISNNGGVSWYASEEDANYSAACGHHGEYLWVAGASMSVHKQRSNTAE